MPSRNHHQKQNLPAAVPYHALFLGYTGDCYPVCFPCTGPEDLAAKLKRIIGGFPGLVPVQDHSGDYLVYNKQADAIGLPQNFMASVMAGHVVSGNCLCCKPVVTSQAAASR